MIQIALIIGTTRPNRFADRAAEWTVDGAKSRTDFTLSVLDLRDYPLPFFAEPVTPTMSKGVYTDPEAEKWRRKIGEFDGYIATAAEYNHGPAAVLKNALDSAYNEWNRKPITFVGYGTTGGARAVEHLRAVAIELQMAPIRHAVHIGFEPFLGVVRGGKKLDSFDYLNQSRTAMFDHLVWWAKALKIAREEAAAAAA